jgi:hypothetical protein
LYEEIYTLVDTFAEKVANETEAMCHRHTKELVLLVDKKTAYDQNCETLGKEVVDRQLLISYYQHKQKVELNYYIDMENKGD